MSIEPKTDKTEKVEDALFEHIAQLIEKSRQYVKSTINTAMVYTYYGIGKYIVEDEQQGEGRAKYGKNILKQLSKRLTERFGTSWTVDTLKRCRFFYKAYTSAAIGATPLPQLEDSPKFTLSWSHYLILMRIENPDERHFYEIEAKQQNWSVRQLGRQVGSCLYERLALSRNKTEVMWLAKEGQTIEKPSDIIKDPITLEFLGLKPDLCIQNRNLRTLL